MSSKRLSVGLTRWNGARHGSRAQHPRCGLGSGAPHPRNVLTRSVIPDGLVHLGRDTQKDAELAVILENGRGVDEADVAESGTS
jgi:hypothetical protein